MENRSFLGWILDWEVKGGSPGLELHIVSTRSRLHGLARSSNEGQLSVTTICRRRAPSASRLASGEQVRDLERECEGSDDKSEWKPEEERESDPESESEPEDEDNLRESREFLVPHVEDGANSLPPPLS